MQVTPVDTNWVDTDRAFEVKPMQIRSRMEARDFKSGDRPGLYAGTLPLEALKAVMSIAANKKETFSKMHIDVSRACFHAKARIERTRVSVECEVPVVKVFARCVRLWLPDSHVFWARFRHRLTYCSHGFRESCHRCVHRSVRRLLTNYDHLCSELIELTSQHLNFLSRCHRHSISQYRKTRNKSIPQFQDNRLRYHASMGNHAKRVNVRCALCMIRALFKISDLGPRRLCIT